MSLFTRKICKNCRWWQEHNQYEGFCRLDGEIAVNLTIPTRGGRPAVWAKHDEVRTSPDFGCNQFEKREGR